jgi:2-methylcitrate dehydratase
MACRITLTLRDGQKVEREKRDYEGFRTRPMSWEAAVEKFEKLTSDTDQSLRRKIVDAVSTLESVEVADLSKLLGKIRGSSI